MEAALESLSGQGAKAFVLDLRGNSGGYFPGGVDVARLFLPEQRFQRVEFLFFFELE